MPQATSIYATIVFAVDMCTFVLLAAQYRTSRSTWLLVLGCAYLYSGLLAVLHLLTFPGALINDGPLIGGRESVAWLYLFWGVGFVSLIFASAVTYVAGDHTLPADRSVNAILIAAVAGIFAGVAMLFFLATVGAPVLPSLMSGDRFSPPDIAMNSFRSVIAASALAVLWTARRRRATTVHVWVCLTLAAAAVGPLLTDLGGGRYTFGWYAGRVSFVFASSIVLFALFAEFIKLQYALAGAIVRLKAQAQSLHAEIARRETAERKLVQAQRLEAMGRLSCGIAHDFNNLLTVIVSNLELLLRTATDDTVKRLAAKAKDVALKGGRLTRSLLAFGQRQPLRAALVNVAEVIDRLCALLDGALGATVEVDSAVGEDMWCCLADPEQLEVALLNLAFNARDAMPGGGVVRIDVRNEVLHEASMPAGSVLRPGEYVAMAVSDSGVGIPARHADKIFEPFFTTKGPGQGTGLGLSQVQGFARQSGGDVIIVSVEGRGTTVTLYLPRATADIGTAQQGEARGA